ncbi:riboflavin-binding -like [Pelobates cultripes]|uniref:Riboflavin-binding -like n=1 Tax=Pelobates cultripes TaxID=61616 RepID=A0AAD1WJS0_PELCU|nr:riboflavin-binding -like [Pelobates cultripes]
MKILVTLLVYGALSAVSGQQTCLLGKHHKASPSAEIGAQECVLYAESSCCYANFTEKLSQSPIIKVDNYYWNRCGNLSKACEAYMKKIECFYQCSPLAAHWIHPNMSFAIEHVPLCQSFCDSWFEACRSDLVCARDWLVDWIVDENGNHCKNECIPYHQMYANGTDLCQTAWGASFEVSSSACHCLDMTETDRNVIKYILGQENSEESGEQEACKPRLQKLQEQDEKEEDEND